MEDLDELTFVGSGSDAKYAYISLVDDNYRDMSLVQHYLPHIFNSTTSFGDEDGVKGFSLLVLHEE